jgi:formylglycine-generating enzyme required for sulfatase activity
MNDYHGPLPTDEKLVNPEGPKWSDSHVLRGGSISADSVALQSGWRHTGTPFRQKTIGLRLVRVN